MSAIFGTGLLEKTDKRMNLTLTQISLTENVLVDQLEDLVLTGKCKEPFGNKNMISNEKEKDNEKKDTILVH